MVFQQKPLENPTTSNQPNAHLCAHLPVCPPSNKVWLHHPQVLDRSVDVLSLSPSAGSSAEVTTQPHLLR